MARGAGDIMPEIELSREEQLRYGRHIILPQIGEAGQKKLKAARALIIGAGGLGSPLALYLAAAGVGTIGIVDFDTVDASNLHRQILHTTQSIGISKLLSASQRIHDINPNVNVELHETRLTSKNALDVLKNFDIVADGTDNFPTRYLVNDACVLLGKPNIYGSIFRFEGQASVFYANKGPCYRCLFPEPPLPGDVQNCAEGGVLGVLPGIIGTIQANETIKILLGIGEPLIGRLLLFDALAMQFRELQLKKNPECPACGKNPTVTHLIDYDYFCGVQTNLHTTMNNEITPLELKKKLDAGENVLILDVRESNEYAAVNISGTLIPLGQLPQRYSELDPAQEIVVHCHHGGRSMRAVQFLQQKGFTNVKNLTGGIDRWAVEVNTELKRY